ncbi:MAG: hypothetical protein JXQ29_05025 [Planctomycetes bacterium]|nr:hypothetical protein [Planctomycetota bacterium]
MRLPVLVLAVLALLGSTAATQSYTGDFLLGGAVYGTSDGVFRVDRKLAVTTITTGITPASTGHYVWEVIMAEDNQNYYALSANYNTVNRIVKLDPNGTILATVVVGTTALLKSAVNLHLNQNGKLVVYDCGGSTTLSYLYEVDPATGAVATLATFPKGDSYYGSATIDFDSGDDLVFVYDSVFRVDRATGAVSTPVVIGTRVARMSFEQDPLTGKGYAGTCCTNTLWELDIPGGKSTLLVGPLGLYGIYGLRFDRRVDATLNKFYIAYGGFGSATYRNGIALMDTQGVLTSIVSWQAGTGQPMPYSLEIEGSREVQAVLFSAPNDRRILLSFPNHGGKPYVAAVNISGVRPGLRLGDGRIINMVPDSIFFASVSGALDPLLPGRVGILSPFGKATAGLALNVLGNVRGLPMWYQVVVLDPLAPKGIAAIAEPYPIKLE